MELQDYIKLHEMKAEATGNIEEESSIEPIRTSVSYTKEEHEELVSMLKELQRYRYREAAYLSNAMQEDYLRRNWKGNHKQKALQNDTSLNYVWLESEVMKAAIKLLSCFRGSCFLTDREPIEFLADEKSNTYFVLGNCETKEDVDCKVLEYISRAAYKIKPYKTDISNENFHRSMLAGINAYLGTAFTKEDIEIIYTHLGNRCNHQKTIEFVRSGFDMGVFLKEEEREI